MFEEFAKLGFGVNLGYRVDKTPPWICAVFALWRKENYKDLGTYACKQASSMEEAMRLCMEEIKKPPRTYHTDPDIKSIIDELGLHV